MEIRDGLLDMVECDQEIEVEERGKQIFALALTFARQRFDCSAVG